MCPYPDRAPASTTPALLKDRTDHKPSTKESPIPGFKTLLLGGTGTGKTYSLGRLAELGFNVRIMFTEPGQETIGKYFADRGQPIPSNIAWHYIKPMAPSWEA